MIDSPIWSLSVPGEPTRVSGANNAAASPRPPNFTTKALGRKHLGERAQLPAVCVGFGVTTNTALMRGGCISKSGNSQVQWVDFGPGFPDPTRDTPGSSSGQATTVAASAACGLSGTIGGGPARRGIEQA